jgi:hypothetical protein
MTDNLKQFNSEIDKFVKTIPDMVTTLQKKIVLEALKRLVEKTPVDTGRARGNWQVAIDAAAEGQLIVTDKEGIATVEKGLSVLTNLPPYSVVWISNNVDYIEFLEYGTSRGPTAKLTSEGRSTQAPEGMLAITVEELQVMFEKAIE